MIFLCINIGFSAYYWNIIKIPFNISWDIMRNGWTQGTTGNKPSKEIILSIVISSVSSPLPVSWEFTSFFDECRITNEISWSISEIYDWRWWIYSKWYWSSAQEGISWKICDHTAQVIVSFSEFQHSRIHRKCHSSITMIHYIRHGKDWFSGENGFFDITIQESTSSKSVKSKGNLECSGISEIWDRSIELNQSLGSK